LCREEGGAWRRRRVAAAAPRAGHRRDRPRRRPGRFGREGSSEEEREEGKRGFLESEGVVYIVYIGGTTG